jgi:REP element-mobilizing transposase RayT
MRMQIIREWLDGKHVGQAFQPAFASVPANWPGLRKLTREDLRVVSFSRRRLPHWELDGSTYFVTFRTIGPLGAPLESSMPASMVEEALWYGCGERYVLDAYVIMPDHVHVLMMPSMGWSLAKILQSIKGFTAREINKVLGRKGSFWQDESFDHLIRDEMDWQDKFNYIHDNPVEAGLVNRAQDFPFSSLVTIYSKGRLESLPHMLHALAREGKDGQ